MEARGVTMPHVTLLEHQGQPVVKTVFPRMSSIPGLMHVLAETNQVFKTLEAGSILSLVRFEGQDFTQAQIDLFEKVARANASVVKATAFLGIGGAQVALFNAMISITNRKAQLFTDEAQALDWLVEATQEEDLLAGL